MSIGPTIQFRGLIAPDKGDKVFVQDYCELSTNILKERVETYFRETLQLENLWIVDSQESLLNPPRFEEVVEVILFGDYLNDLLRSGCWCFEKFRLWVLSQSSKDVLCQAFDLPEHSVGVIPRDQLFSVNQEIKSLVEGPVNLVYGGRLNEVKNVLFLLDVYKELEKTLDIRLHLYGWFDNQTKYDRPSPENFQSLFDHKVHHSSWKNAPVYHGSLDSDQWVLKQQENAVFISLSLYEKEDFSVTATQAREAGLPLILSHWGGHRYFSSCPGTHMVDSQWIAHHLEPLDIQEMKVGKASQEVAKAIESFRKLNLDSNKSDKHDFPDICDIRDIDRLRRDFLGKTFSAMLLEQDKWYEFYKTQGGSFFFDEFSRLMSGNTCGKDVFIFVPGFLETKAPIPSFYERSGPAELLEELGKENTGLKVVDAKFFKAWNAKKLENIEAQFLVTSKGEIERI